MNTKMIVVFVAIALVASTGVVSAGDFTCRQLVELGLLNASSIVYGTLYLPQGYVQINGGLFDTSDESETGLIKGEAYDSIDYSMTGTFYGEAYYI